MSVLEVLKTRAKMSPLAMALIRSGDPTNPYAVEAWEDAVVEALFRRIEELEASALKRLLEAPPRSIFIPCKPPHIPRKEPLEDHMIVRGIRPEWILDDPSAPEDWKDQHAPECWDRPGCVMGCPRTQYIRTGIWPKKEEQK